MCQKKFDIILDNFGKLINGGGGPNKERGVFKFPEKNKRDPPAYSAPQSNYLKLAHNLVYIIYKDTYCISQYLSSTWFEHVINYGMFNEFRELEQNVIILKFTEITLSATIVTKFIR